jgi:type I restriction enzyme M protein
VFCLPPAINCQRLHDTTIIITTNYKSQFWSYLNGFSSNVKEIIEKLSSKSNSSMAAKDVLMY